MNSLGGGGGGRRFDTFQLRPLDGPGEGRGGARQFLMNIVAPVESGNTAFGAAPAQRLVCTGKAYVLAGNPANVGKPGFPGVTVTNGSAAVIPRQFTGQLTGGPFMRSIGASTFGTVTGPRGATESFNAITQAVGNLALGTAQQAQDIIMGRDPGALVIEIVGGTNTWKDAGLTINMPDLGQGCPGTSLPAQ
jgi:hypothetical protein